MQQINLHSYQNAAKEFIKDHTHCGLFLPVGLGKTLITLQALYELNPHGNILIIAPLNVAKSTWINEINKWGFPFRTKSLILNKKGKKLSKKKRLGLYEEAYTCEPTIFFINKDLVTDIVKNMPVINGQRTWCYPTVIIDELQAFKSYKAERFKALMDITPNISRFIGLTGTPTPKSLEDLWSEIYLMDGGQRLGPNITHFRETYFVAGRCMNNYPIEWIIRPGIEDVIYQKISDIVISMKNTMLTLPPVTYNPISVHMNEEEKELYCKMRKDSMLIFDENGNPVPLIKTNTEGQTIITAVNAGVLNMKLTQMASGALYLDKSNKYMVIHTKKLEMTEYIINNAGDNVLIAYHFQSDKDMLMRYLRDPSRDIDARIFDGSPQMLADWNAGKIPVMLVQPASAGAGLNMQEGGHTLIWYTIPFSLEEYIQMNGRIYRQGQKNPVIIHQLLTKGTVDNKNLYRLEEKDMTQQALLNAVEYGLLSSDFDTEEEF